MCLESSKQSYLLLRVLQEADGGLKYFSLMLKMAELSREEFGTAGYVDIPLPTNALIEHAELAGEIGMTSSGLWRITEKGGRLFSFLKRREIASLQDEEVEVA